MSASVGRNDPCPCGSGLKYKQCCEGKALPRMRGRRGWLLGVAALAALALIAWGIMRSQSPSVANPGLGLPPAGTGATAGTTPLASPGAVNPSAEVPAPPGVKAEPWAYDAATNRHFDPSHGHWHNGPPPPPESRSAASAMPAPGATPSTPTPGPTPTTPTPGLTPPTTPPGPTPTTTTPGPTPAAWTYDPVKNQHWDPAHQHWHTGPPPAGSR